MVKTIHLFKKVIVNGDPGAGHYPGCQPVRSAQIHAENEETEGVQARAHRTFIGGERPDQRARGDDAGM